MLARLKKKALLFLYFLSMTPTFLCAGNILFSLNSTMTQNKPFTSIFGDLIADDRTDYVAEMFQYGLSSLESTTLFIGTGFLTFPNSSIQLHTGTAASAATAIRSNKVIRYKPGHEAYCVFTAQFSTGLANSQQFIGLVDQADLFSGFYLGYIGSTSTQFSVIWNNNGSQTATVQTNFNRDKLNGTGPSGFVLNPQNYNIYRISFGWLGSAIVKFQVMDQNGNWILFHEFNFPNNYQTPSIPNASIAMEAFVSNGGNTSDVTLTTAAWNSGIVGTESNENVSRYFSKNSNFFTISTTGVDTFLLALQNVSSFNGAYNRVTVRLNSVNGAVTNSIGASFIIFKVIKNATLSGTTFVNIDPVNSVVQYSAAGTYTAGSGTLVQHFSSGNSSPAIGTKLASQFYDSQQQYFIYMLPGDTLTITAQNLSGTGGIIGCTVNWEEQF